jgi:cob(I)alamin adenosyltransferase
MEDIHDLEKEIDQLDEGLDPLKNFVLPGSGVLNGKAHICRAVCRRVERIMVSFHEEQQEEVPTQALMYLNRLSDYFFILSRYFTKCEQEAEIKWISQKGK